MKTFVGRGRGALVMMMMVPDVETREVGSRSGVSPSPSPPLSSLSM